MPDNRKGPVVGFTLIEHPDLGGAKAVVHEAAVPIYMERGWKVADSGAEPAATPGEVEGAPDTNTFTGPQQPAGNASADDWRAYAISHGVSAEEATALGRDELKALFVSKEN